MCQRGAAKTVKKENGEEKVPPSLMQRLLSLEHGVGAAASDTGWNLYGTYPAGFAFCFRATT